MKINYIKTDDTTIAEVQSEEIVIKTVQDVLDLFSNCCYSNDARKIIISEKNLTPEFFDLKTKIAGEILQKFVNYKVEIAIVGDFSKYTSKSLKDFIYESNKHKKINFVDSVDKAVKILSGNK